MEREDKTPQDTESVNILLVGNNPIELSKILDTLQKLPGRKVITEIAFDLRSIWERLIRFSPNYILIDDNIGRSELGETVSTLLLDKRTKDVPITVLKNSNYQEALATSDIMDYVLKQNLTGDALYNTLKNSLKFRRAKQYLMDMYNRRKKEFLKLAY
jgi:CheY-like chemotaxis protein